MKINTKIILFTILELAFLLLIRFIGIYTIILSLIIMLVEIEICELTYEKIDNKI